MTACARPAPAVAGRTAIAHSGRAFTRAVMQNLVTMAATSRRGWLTLLHLEDRELAGLWDRV
jgi:hypothetical protein